MADKLHHECQDECQSAAGRGPAYRCNDRPCDMLACEEYDRKRLNDPATTLCWSCLKEYPTTKRQCPHCCVSNANTHLEWAQEEQADPSTIDHDWEYIADWEGDPGVINGTHNLYYKRCRRCGEEGEWDGQCADDYEEDYRE